MLTIEALKSLAVALGCADAVANVTGDTIADVIDFMSDNYTAPVPAVPTTAGTYNVVVDSNGAATWTSVG